MIHHTSSHFRKAYKHLPHNIQLKAEKEFSTWEHDPQYPSLHFKHIHNHKPIYSLRIDLHWRALGVQHEDTITWFWIGSHAGYDKLLAQL